MTVYQQISRNKRRTIFLMMVFIALLLGMGYAGAEAQATGTGPGGLILAGGFSLIMVLLSYFQGDSLALLTAGAKEIQKEDNPRLWNTVENLSITAGMPMPKVYVIDDPMMNAFATGRKPEKAAVAFTTGLLHNLTDTELEGVAAHELSHIQNYDTRLMVVVVVLVGAITLLAEYMWRMYFFGNHRRNSNGKGAQIELIFMVVSIVLIILSPLFAELIKLAISRKREYLADASAVLLTRYSDGLISALRKIGNQGDVELQRANHATAHLYIANPFKPSRLYSRLSSTHPPIEERIKALQQMGGDAGA